MQKSYQQLRHDKSIKYDLDTYACNRKWDIPADLQDQIVDHLLAGKAPIGTLARTYQMPRQDVIDIVYRYLNKLD